MSEWEDAFGEWCTVAVSVRTYQGPGPKGPILAAAVMVGPDDAGCGVMVKDANRLVRGSDAEERVSDASLVMPSRLAVHFSPESEVTLPDGRVRDVLSRSVDEAGLPLAHCRVVLS